jgi:hypothetical protein
MFERADGEQLVSEIEATYKINLNARADTKLKNLLLERGFDSLSQLLKAYRGQADSHSKRRRIFPSFNSDDIQQVGGFRLMVSNPNVDLDLDVSALQTLVQSANMTYVRRQLAAKIERAEVLVCLIGNGTAWREMVEWEIQTAIGLHRGICGVRLKDSRGRAPALLKEYGAPVAGWDIGQIVSAIECAAARRSWPR